MKRLILLIALALFAGSATYAQSAKLSKFFEKYSDVDGITAVNVNGNFNFQDDEGMMSEVNGIKVLTHEGDAKIDMKQFYDEAVKAMMDDGYVQMVNVQEGDETVNIYLMNDKEGQTKGMAVAVLENDEAVIVYIDGNLDFSKMAQMMSGFDVDIDIDDE